MAAKKTTEGFPRKGSAGATRLEVRDPAVDGRLVVTLQSLMICQTEQCLGLCCFVLLSHVDVQDDRRPADVG